MGPRGQTRRKPRKHFGRDVTILAVLLLAFGTWGGVEDYGRSIAGAFAVAVVVLACIGLIVFTGTRNRDKGR